MLSLAATTVPQKVEIIPHPQLQRQGAHHPATVDTPIILAALKI
jgi:hypothetical protein